MTALIRLRALPVFLVLSLFLFFFQPLASDGDFFHHAATGKYILTTGSFPHADPFTFSATGKPWIAHSWLSGILFHVVYSSFGPVGVSALIAATGMLTIVFLTKTLRLMGINPKAIHLTVFLIIPMLLMRFPARPESFGLLLTAALLYIEQKRKTIPQIALIFPVILLLWTNLYGAGAILGVILLVFFTVRELIANSWRIPVSHRFYFAMAWAGIAASLATPYGAHSLFYLSYIGRIGPLQGEWAGIPTILTAAPLPYLIDMQYKLAVYALFVTEVFITSILIIRKIRAIQVILPFLLILAPVASFRHSGFAAILAAPFVALTVENSTKTKSRARLVFIPIALVSLGFALFTAHTGWLRRDQPFSPELVSFIRTHHLTGNALNNQHIGGYLTYYLYPDVKIWTDTRDEVYLATSVLTDYIRTVSMGKSITTLTDTYGADMIIADYVTGGVSFEPLFYDPAWAVIYLSNHYLVALKRQRAREMGIPALDALDPFRDSGAKPGRETQALSYYAALSVREPTISNRLFHARALAYTGRFEEAQTVLTSLAMPPGPTRPLTSTEVLHLSGFIAAKTGACGALADVIRRLRREQIFLFPIAFWLRQKSPTIHDVRYAFGCTRDAPTANTLLRAYLAAPGLSPRVAREIEAELGTSFPDL